MRLKRLENGLLVVGGAFVMWHIAKIVALSAYSKKGPFVSLSAPPIDQIFLNGVENYLNAGVAKSGVPIVSWFGPYTVTTTYTYFNHNLHDASGANVTPDIVIPMIHSTSANSLHSVFADLTSMTTTQVKLGNDGGSLTVYGIALKF